MHAWAQDPDFARRPDPPSPVPPAPDCRQSEAALARLAHHRPGFFEKLFQLRGPRQRLESEVEEARSLESARHAQAVDQHTQAMQAHQRTCADLREMRAFAARMLKPDPMAYGEALEGFECFAELGALIGRQNIDLVLKEKQIDVSLSVLEEVVPPEAKSLTKTGKVSRRKMPATRRMETYQDYVCGSALRVAREVLAVTPVEGVLVHISKPILNTATGHKEDACILSVYCPRASLAAIRWDRVDASDLVETLLHRMKITRGKGFRPVEALSMPDPVGAG